MGERAARVELVEQAQAVPHHGAARVQEQLVLALVVHVHRAGGELGFRDDVRHGHGREPLEADAGQRGALDPTPHVFPVFIRDPGHQYLQKE